MKYLPHVFVLALAAGLALPASAQVGMRLPAKVELENFAQTKATSFEDYQGRALLIEFFAFW